MSDGGGGACFMSEGGGGSDLSAGLGSGALRKKIMNLSQAVVYMNFQAGSTFPVPVCTVLSRHWVNKADTE